MEIGSGRTTEEQLRCCFPALATIPVAALFKPLERPAALLALPGPAPGFPLGPRAAVELGGGQDSAIAPRTRAQRRRAEAEAASRASLESVAPAASSSSAPVLGRTRSESRLLQSRHPVGPCSLHP